MTTANFFWHGSALSLYEESCLKSFVRNNFTVNIYSYEKLKKISDVNNINAEEILPISTLAKYTENKKYGFIASFSDEFRIHLMKNQKGWWFDMDIICLKNSEDFDLLEQNRKIVAGYEEGENIANGVLKINDQFIISEILNEIEKADAKSTRGGVGPELIKKTVKKRKLSNEMLAQKFLFPVNYKNFHWLFIPEKKEEVKRLYEKSYLCHFYNEILNRFSYTKNILPPEGSFLHEKIIESDPGLISRQCLPVNSFLRLIGKKDGSVSFGEHLNDLIPSFVRMLKHRVW